MILKIQIKNKRFKSESLLSRNSNFHNQFNDVTIKKIPTNMGIIFL